MKAEFTVAKKRKDIGGLKDELNLYTNSLSNIKTQRAEGDVSDVIERDMYHTMWRLEVIKKNILSSEKELNEAVNLVKNKIDMLWASVEDGSESAVLDIIMMLKAMRGETNGN